MKINCPKCDYEFEVDNEDVPDTASEDGDCRCPECEYEFKFGWYATLEVR